MFSDHVALPFKLGCSQRLPEFAHAGIAEDVVFIGSGRLGFPDAALLALALGCDMINVGREAMLAIGCIQAQRCHTGSCPTGVATQNRWLMRGLDPELKSARAANYLVALRKELLSLARACGARTRRWSTPPASRSSASATRRRRSATCSATGRSGPCMSARRRAEVESLIGPSHGRRHPGPEAGEHAGIPGAGEPDREHQDLRGMGGNTA